MARSIPKAISPASIRLWLLEVYATDLSLARKAYVFIDEARTSAGAVMRMHVVNAMPLSPECWDQALQFLDGQDG